MPKEKIFRKPEEFDRNPWNVGDLYAYQFHNKAAHENGLNEKYIVFQKIGYANDFDKLVSVIQVYDKVFDTIPTINQLSGVRILPLTYSPGIHGTPNRIEDYVPSFEMTLRCKMVYEKREIIPKIICIFWVLKIFPIDSLNIKNAANSIGKKIRWMIGLLIIISVGKM